MAGETPSGGNSTRFIETSCGILSYSQLAPLLAERVLRVEQQVSAGAFARHSLGSDLICDLHLRIASDLLAEWAGRWRTSEVVVGNHSPPPPYQVALHMRDFGDDLEARLETAFELESGNLLESRAFAVGRLLSIHPFFDFNGRVTRLFLSIRQSNDVYHPFDNEPGEFIIFINHLNQQSLWPSAVAIPLGWKTMGPRGSKKECLEWVNTHWTDLRPRQPAASERGDNGP